MSDEAIVRQLTRSAVSHLVERVMAERGWTLPDAMQAVFSSSLYSKIQDSQTGLYREGPVYLYSLFCESSPAHDVSEH